MAKMKLTFCGGVDRVTGSNFLLEDSDSGKTKILIDCGFFQGCDVCDAKNLESFPYKPDSIDVVFVTHAHLDHIGRLPRLVKEGFRGRIISTPPTKDIAELVFLDSLDILDEESKRYNRPLPYVRSDIEKTMELWETTPYRKDFILTEQIHVKLRDAGHILGSAMIEIKINGKKILFTGDLGNSPAPLLSDTEEIDDATYLVIESVYGDRNHESKDERRDKLEDVIEETARRKGALLIPAFSIERTQEILFEIETMMRNDSIPLIPVFLDSPLAIKVTEVYKKYEEYYNKGVQNIIRSGEDLFRFPQLRLTETKDESEDIHNFINPKIIIAGSGMSNAGRILEHEKRYLPDSKSMLLFVGYQAPGSLGREIQDGARDVSIQGHDISVHAHLETIRGYSAHKDSDGLFKFVVQTTDTLSKVFIVAGEPKSSAFLAQRLRDYLGIDTSIPHEGDSIELDF